VVVLRRLDCEAEDVTVKVEGEEVLLGRGPLLGLELSYVSRRHASFTWNLEEGQMELRSLHKNPTRHYSKELEQWTELSRDSAVTKANIEEGDKIEIIRDCFHFLVCQIRVGDNVERKARSHQDTQISLQPQEGRKKKRELPSWMKGKSPEAKKAKGKENNVKSVDRKDGSDCRVKSMLLDTLTEGNTSGKHNVSNNPAADSEKSKPDTNNKGGDEGTNLEDPNALVIPSISDESKLNFIDENELTTVSEAVKHKVENVSLQSHSSEKTTEIDMKNSLALVDKFNPGDVDHNDLISQTVDDTKASEGESNTSPILRTQDDVQNNDNGETIKKQKPNNPTPNLTRPSCPYGASCYRKNPKHRDDLAHPEDDDYQESGPSPDDDSDKPECEYGTNCYRKNPQHWTDFKHSNKHQPKRKVKVKKPKTKKNEDEYESDFINDDSDEWEPVDDSDDDADWNPVGSEGDSQEDI